MGGGGGATVIFENSWSQVESDDEPLILIA